MILGEGNEKMSKFKGNVINFDDIVKFYGVDILCFYEMFMGFLDVVIVWSEKGLDGFCWFLDRVWCLMVNEDGILSLKIVIINNKFLDKVYN